MHWTARYSQEPQDPPKPRPKEIRVYVAGPYSQGDNFRNVRTAILAGEELAAYGLVPFIPHLFAFWDYLSPHPYDFWMKLDAHWLRACDAILRLPGESVGADTECIEARALNIPVFDSIAGLTEWAGLSVEKTVVE